MIHVIDTRLRPSPVRWPHLPGLCFYDRILSWSVPAGYLTHLFGGRQIIATRLSRSSESVFRLADSAKLAMSCPAPSPPPRTPVYSPLSSPSASPALQPSSCQRWSFRSPLVDAESLLLLPPPPSPQLPWSTAPPPTISRPLQPTQIPCRRIVPLLLVLCWSVPNGCTLRPSRGAVAEETGSEGSLRVSMGRYCEATGRAEDLDFCCVSARSRSS